MKKSVYYTFLIIIGLATLFLGCETEPQNKTISKEDALYSFAKLYGYIKYFHPSDEAQEIDWDKFAIYGAKEVKTAKTKQDLKVILERLFEPIAPTLKISFSLDSTFKYQFHDLILDKKIDTISWQHYGNGEMSTKGYYKSSRTNRNEIISLKNERSYTVLDLSNLNTNYDSLKIQIKTKHDSTSWNTVSDLTVGFFKKDGSIKYSKKKSIWRSADKCISL